MWPRIIEVMLGCWLMISPFIFRLSPDQTFLWVSDLAAGAAVIGIALTACSPRYPRLRLLNLISSAYLVIVAFLAAPPPPPPAYQNYVVIGLLILITAVIPTRGVLPPQKWQQFYENRNG